MVTALKEPHFSFDDTLISWAPFPGIDNAKYSLCDFDEERSIIDLVFKFDADKKVAIHTHIWQTNMFIIEGELRMYETDGTVKEIRSAGKYFRGCEQDTHSEGGGPEGAVVFYSLRGNGGNNVFDLLDDQGKLVTTVTTTDVRNLWEEKLKGN